MGRIVSRCVVLLAAVTPPTAWAEMVTFDPRQVVLQRDGGRWQLVQGTVVIKDFGTAEAAAQEALRLVRDWKLTQRGSVGRPWPVMEYWLADGTAPNPVVPPRGLFAFDRRTLRVDQVRGQWCLRDATQVLLAFGPHADDAREALAVIHRHGFGRVGQVGHGPGAMMYFLGDDPTRPESVDTPETPAALPLTRVDPNQLSLVRALVPEASAGEVIRLDGRQIEVVRRDGHWLLCQAGYCLADYGSNEAEAREALRVLHEGRFTEQCRLGPPGAGLTFYLSNGQPPRAVPFGHLATAFAPEALEVRETETGWTLADAGNRVRWEFGDDEAAARHARDVLRRYRLDHLCRIGTGPQPLTLLVRGR
jgi:hypothetical protein